MVNHRQRLLYVGLVVDEFFGRIILTRYLVHVFVRMRQQTNKIRRSTALEPVVGYPVGSKSIEQTERIVHIGHCVAEMVTVVLYLEHCLHFLVRTTVVLRHRLYRLPESNFQFLLRNTAKCFVLAMHTDIKWLVESTEHAYLREFGDTRQEDKLQMFVGTLENRVKGFQYITVLFFQIFVHIKYVQNRLVIFVNQHHRTATALLVGFGQYVPESYT